MIFSQIITVGINDRNALEEGWYGLEKSPEGLVYRASAREALLKVLSPGSGCMSRCCFPRGRNTRMKC